MKDQEPEPAKHAEEPDNKDYDNCMDIWKDNYLTKHQQGE